LRKERIEAPHADAAAVVDGLGERVGTGHAQPLAETPGDLDAAGVAAFRVLLSATSNCTPGAICLSLSQYFSPPTN
jgi:hypothetical protein